MYIPCHGSGAPKKLFAGLSQLWFIELFSGSYHQVCPKNCPLPKDWSLEIRFLTFLILSSWDLWYKQHFCKAVLKSELWLLLNPLSILFRLFFFLYCYYLWAWNWGCCLERDCFLSKIVGFSGLKPLREYFESINVLPQFHNYPHED